MLTRRRTEADQIDDGPEFISKPPDRWPTRRLHASRLATLKANRQSAHRIVRRNSWSDSLNATWFLSLKDANESYKAF